MSEELFDRVCRSICQERCVECGDPPCYQLDEFMGFECLNDATCENLAKSVMHAVNPAIREAKEEAKRWQENHKGAAISKRAAQAKTEEFRVAAKKAEATADEAVRLLEAVLRESDRDTTAYRAAREFLEARK